MLFNEIYYFNSIFFNANSFIKDSNFKSYFLTGGRVLDNRENYTKVKLPKERTCLEKKTNTYADYEDCVKNNLPIYELTRKRINKINS